jgi:hypothetical protein
VDDLVVAFGINSWNLPALAAKRPATIDLPDGRHTRAREAVPRRATTSTRPSAPVHTYRAGLCGPSNAYSHGERRFGRFPPAVSDPVERGGLAR